MHKRQIKNLPLFNPTRFWRESPNFLHANISVITVLSFSKVGMVTIKTFVCFARTIFVKNSPSKLSGSIPVSVCLSRKSQEITRPGQKTLHSLYRWTWTFQQEAHRLIQQWKQLQTKTRRIKVWQSKMRSRSASKCGGHVTVNRQA